MTVLLTLLVCLAPAPFWRERPSAAPTGTWVAQRGAVRITLSADGTYHEVWHGMTYTGSWSLRRGQLTVVCWVDTHIYRLRFVRRGDTMLLHGFSVELHREGRNEQ